MSLQESLEHAGPLAFTAITVVASCIPCMPMTVINLAAGSLFGLWLGSALFLGACSLGSVLPVLLVRSSLRPWVISKLRTYEAQVRAIDAALDREGPVKMVTLIRLSPAMPTALASYILGMTEVPLLPFTLGTLAGLMPFSVVYVFMGAFGKDMVSRKEEGGGQDHVTLAMTVLGLVATLVLMWKLAKIAQQALDASAAGTAEPSTGLLQTEEGKVPDPEGSGSCRESPKA